MVLPERGGHCSVHRLLVSFAGSQSPSSAHTETTLPPVCLMEPSATNTPSTSKAGLFVEFPPRRGKWIFVVGVLALRDRPRAQIFF